MNVNYNVVVPDGLKIVTGISLPMGGKTLHFKAVANDLGLHYLDTGSMLRARAEKMDALGKTIQLHLSRCELVPDEPTTSVLNEYLRQLNGAVKILLLAGYPRNRVQADLIVSHLISAVHFDITEDVARSRRNAIKNGEIKAEHRNGRTDDTKDLAWFEARITSYVKKTKRLLTRLPKRGCQVISIKGDRPVESVRNELTNHMRNLMKSCSPVSRSQHTSQNRFVSVAPYGHATASF